jgi:uncharacterized protein (DUF2235 family)
MRQLILLCDGTNNNLTGAANDTHVVTLAEVLRRDPDPDRLVFYDPGVGNPGQVPGTTVWDKLRRQFERIEGLAFGRGVYDNIAEGYLFLMRHWRGEADQIWFFGFSRGAFTARSIAGLVNRFGILQPQMESMVPTLLQLYFSESTDPVKAIDRQAIRLFAVGTERHPLIHFVGVWDTVASVGTWPFALRIKAQPTLQNKHFVHVRQALALDEHRAQFVPRAYAENNGATTLANGLTGSVVQQWFRGSHCDVGGGYPVADAAMARAPLAWLMAEAVQCGLRLRHAGQALLTEADAATAVSHTVAQVLGAPDPVPKGPHAAVVHSQLQKSPVWALTGLALRDTRLVVIDSGADVPVRMGEHPSVAAWNGGAFPSGTVWQHHPLKGWWWVHLVLIAAWMLTLGQLLDATPDAAPGIWAAIKQWFSDAALYLRANGQFQTWQLTAFTSTDGGWWRTVQGFDSPRWALVWDLGLIASYGYVLATMVSRAFAHAAGLNRLGLAIRPVLNRLGWALPLMVFADVGENLFSWLTITLGHNELWALAAFGRVGMALCAAAKLVGLLGVLVLLVGRRGLSPRQVQPAADGKVAAG